MGNPLWVSGVSGNPEGARRHSVRTPKGMIEAFIRKQIPPKRLKALYDKLSAKDQADFILALLPYTMSKVSSEGLSKTEVDELWNKVQDVLKNGKQEIA